MYLCMINVNYNDHVLAETRTISLTHNTPIYTHIDSKYNAYITPVTMRISVFTTLRRDYLSKYTLYAYIHYIQHTHLHG